MNMQLIKQFLFFIFIGFILSSCSSVAKKDIYLRSRLPTAELPVFNIDRHVGLTIDLENRRLVTKATHNLVNDFNFYQDEIYYNGEGVPGADLTVTYSHKLGIPLQIGGMTDQLEFKAGIFGYNEAPSDNWFAMIDVAAYKTAAYNDSGKCDGYFLFFCFTTKSEKTKAEENSIDTAQEGTETKAGITIGKNLDPKNALFVAYHKMDYKYDLYSARATGTPTEIRARWTFSAAGYALGYLHRFSEHVAMGVTAEKITVNWYNQDLETILGSLRWNLSF